MTIAAERFATEAEALAGTPFRLHGRNPETGLDCVGLVAFALDRAGMGSRAPQGYTLRNLSIDTYLGDATLSNLQPASGATVRGDILLVSPGPAQHHLLIALGQGRHIHAHAGLRRVVVQSGLMGWPVIKHWRLTAR